MARIQWELFWRIFSENPDCCDEVEGSVNGVYTIFGYLPEAYWRGNPDIIVKNEFPFWVGYCDEPEGASFRTAEKFVSTPLYGGNSVKEVWQQFEIGAGYVVTAKTGWCIPVSPAFSTTRHRSCITSPKEQKKTGKNPHSPLTFPRLSCIISRSNTLTH